MNYFYDRDGNAISAAMFEHLREAHPDYYRIAVDEMDGVKVSTVWLGVDHNFFHDGPPLIFETMVFGGPRDEEQWRWSTEEQARAGHAEICSAVLR